MAALTIAMDERPYTAALLDGSLRPEGLELERAGSGMMFREMVRNLAFDVAELAVFTYLAALDHGLRITAIPVFVTRGFEHNIVFVNSDAGIKHPKDLEGRRIGTRYFAFTDSMWARGLLAESYDVDLDSSTLVVTDDEHVAETIVPGNVEVQPGADLTHLLEAGELDAYIGPYRGTESSVRHLFEDPAAAASEWYDATGIFPIHHLIALRTDVVDAYPDAPRALYQAFATAKAPVLARIEAGAPDGPAEARLLEQSTVVGADPLPYGIEANRPALEAMLRYGHDQHLLSRHFDPDELFAPGWAD
jgi:4,5-dihydroxyphthalate decarboxylase